MTWDDWWNISLQPVFWRSAKGLLGDVHPPQHHHSPHRPLLDSALHQGDQRIVWFKIYFWCLFPTGGYPGDPGARLLGPPVGVCQTVEVHRLPIFLRHLFRALCCHLGRHQVSTTTTTSDEKSLTDIIFQMRCISCLDPILYGSWCGQLLRALPPLLPLPRPPGPPAVAQPHLDLHAGQGDQKCHHPAGCSRQSQRQRIVLHGRAGRELQSGREEEGLIFDKAAMALLSPLVQILHCKRQCQCRLRWYCSSLNQESCCTITPLPSHIQFRGRYQSKNILLQHCPNWLEPFLTPVWAGWLVLLEVKIKYLHIYWGLKMPVPR